MSFDGSTRLSVRAHQHLKRALGAPFQPRTPGVPSPQGSPQPDGSRPIPGRALPVVPPDTVAQPVRKDLCGLLTYLQYPHEPFVMCAC